MEIRLDSGDSEVRLGHGVIARVRDAEFKGGRPTAVTIDVVKRGYVAPPWARLALGIDLLVVLALASVMTRVNDVLLDAAVPFAFSVSERALPNLTVEGVPVLFFGVMPFAFIEVMPFGALALALGLAYFGLGRHVLGDTPASFVLDLLKGGPR